MLIGRNEESKLLLSTLEKEYSSFIAIYGRRRVGKTFLVRETFNYQFTFQHSGIYNASRIDQLNAFSLQLKQCGLTNFENPKNWLEAFSLLEKLIDLNSSPKKVIFLDEISRMDTPNSKFIQALEFFWNSWASSRKDIILIICASASSWVLKKVVHNKGGLYNRLTFSIFLKPWNLQKCLEYSTSIGLPFSKLDILELYTIIGGIPYYWSLLKKNLSLYQNIDYLFFDDLAPLKKEFDYLFASLFSNPQPYVKIIEALYTKKIGLTRDELIQITKLNDNGLLSDMLDSLESSVFIAIYNYYGKKNKNYYIQLIDNFTFFYYKILKENKNKSGYYQKTFNSTSHNVYMGLAFERILFQHIDEIKIALGINGVNTEISSWAKKGSDEEKGCQIDMLISRDDRIINICESKFSYAEYELDKNEYLNIRNKIEVFLKSTKYKGAIQPILITTFGLKQNSYSNVINKVITLDDLFHK